jgi:hypothetical protein
MVDYSIGLALKMRAWMEALKKEMDIKLSELVRSILAGYLRATHYPAKGGPAMSFVMRKRDEALEALAEFAEGLYIVPERALFFAQTATSAYREMKPFYEEPRRKRLKRLSVKLPIFLRNILFVVCRRKGHADDARDPDFSDFSEEELFGLQEKSDPQEILTAAIEWWERGHIYDQIEFTGRGFRLLQT